MTLWLGHIFGKPQGRIVFSDYLAGSLISLIAKLYFPTLQLDLTAKLYFSDSLEDPYRKPYFLTLQLDPTAKLYFSDSLEDPYRKLYFRTLQLDPTAKLYFSDSLDDPYRKSCFPTRQTALQLDLSVWRSHVFRLVRQPSSQTSMVQPYFQTL